MSTVLSNATNKTFYYQILPSTFQLAEAPTYLAWQMLRSSEKLWNQETANSSQRCINRVYAILSGIGGYLGGIIALPITLACTPVTIVADAIIGIAECSFCYYHGLSGNDIKKIAHRKFIVAPLQQFIFCSTAISISIVANILLFGRLVVLAPAWTFGYAFGQTAIGMLPSYLNHRSFNIFIDGGSGEKDGKKWLDDDTLPKESFTHNEDNAAPIPPKDDWQNYIAEEMCNLSRVDDAKADKKYIAFKKAVFEQKTPQELLGLNSGFSRDELRRSYKALVLILHPDKHGGSTEASSLFKILNEAYVRLSRNI